MSAAPTIEVTLHLPAGLGATPLLAAVIDFAERINLDLTTSERLAAGLRDLIAASGKRSFEARLRLVGGGLDLQLVGDPATAVPDGYLDRIEDVASRVASHLDDGRPGLVAFIDGAG